jgi:hypothetical protein
MKWNLPRHKFEEIRMTNEGPDNGSEILDLVLMRNW